MNNQIWRKSSRSSAENECIELSVRLAGARIRDTKNRDAGVLAVGAVGWSALLAAVKMGS